MRRKFAALLLSAAMVCSILAGCSSSGPASSTPSTSKPSNDTSTTTPPGGNNNSNNNSNNNNGNSGNTKPGNSGNDSSDSSNSSTVQKLRIDNFNYNIVPSGTGSKYSYVYVSFSVANPNKDYDIQSVRIDYSIKDTTGAVIETDWDYLPPLASGDSTLFGVELSVENATVKNVSYTVSYGSCVATKHADTNFPKNSSLKISNVSYDSNDGTFDWPYVKGTVSNISSSDISGVNIKVFYKKNGKIVAVDSTHLWDEHYNNITLHAGESLPFSVVASTFLDFEYDSFEVIPMHYPLSL